METTIEAQNEYQAKILRTSEQDMVARLTDAQHRLARFCTEGPVDASTLADRVNEIAKIEGEIDAQYRFTHGGVQAVTLAVFNGADDTWSGRGNDVKRARFDGFRDEAQRIVRGY